MVETPGATRAFTASSTWRTICPLRFIFASSDCDLQLIILTYFNCAYFKLLTACRGRAAFNRAKHFRHYLINRLVPVDTAQPSLLLVKLFQRLGLALIAFQALRYDLFRIVNALEQLGAADVANAFSFGRLEIDVVNLAVDRTGTPACKPLQ